MLSFCKAFHIYGHKHFEIQFNWLTNELAPLRLHFEISHKRDHSGAELHIELLTICGLYLTFHDDRHWNYDANRWYEPGEEEAEWNGEFS
jgi:hypothetical protein